MKKLFIDTSILLDVFLNRESFVEPAAAVFADCESGKVKGIVSAISLNNLHYILSRHIGKSKALEAVRIVLNIFTVAALDEKILRLAPPDLSHKGFRGCDPVPFRSCGRSNLHHYARCLPFPEG